jgi:hypothetical protein
MTGMRAVECDAAWLGGWFPTFRKIVMPSSPSERRDSSIVHSDGLDQ